MKNDGGPAFSQQYFYRDLDDPRLDGLRTGGGMSLRDYFAAAALQGFLANPATSEKGAPPMTVYVVAAYEQADAMLKEREKS